MANVIPMAGLGSRFSKEGYLLPKPLIAVSNKPMIVKVINDLPKSDKWIFIVRKEHIENYQIDKIIKKEIPKAIIIPVEKTTEGQACTCMLAQPFLDDDEELLIAACDNGMLYDNTKFTDLKNNNSVDAIVWTFTKKETLRKNPTAWGWCVLENDNQTIKDMSIKKPISKDPYYDHAVSAIFYFKKTKDFVDAVNLMKKENYRINNEFYVDAVPIYLKKLNKTSIIFDIYLYLSWGTPQDLKEYQVMELICKKDLDIKDIPKENKKNLQLWRKYFSK